MNISPLRLLPVLLLSVATIRADPPRPPAAPAEFPAEAYADMGFAFGDNGKFAKLGWTEAQFEAFLSGVRDAYHGKPHGFGPAAEGLNASISRRLKELDHEEAQAFNEYLKDPARLENYMKEMCRTMRLERSDSGLAFGVQNLSGSVRPEPNDTVVVSWSVRSADTKTELPQLNVSHASFKVARLLPGLTEGVQMMTAGSAALLVLPPDLSFGSGEWPPGIERGLPLVYFVKLEQVVPGS